MREFFGYALASMENIDRVIRQLSKRNRTLISLAILEFGMLMIQDRRIRELDSKMSQMNKKLDTIQKEDKE